jgi:hypothetical protein
MSVLKRITGAADLSSEGKPGSWIDDAAREKFMEAYERAFALWPQPCEEFDVETATATTRVHAYRPHPAGERAFRGNGKRPPTRSGARTSAGSPGSLNPGYRTPTWSAPVPQTPSLRGPRGAGRACRS